MILLILQFLLTADQSGTLEAVVNMLSTFQSNQIELSIMGTGVGPVSENDLRLAETFDGKFVVFMLIVLSGKGICIILRAFY